MSEIIKGDQSVIDGIEKLCKNAGDSRHSSDSFGNSYYWFGLEKPDNLTQAAKILKTPGARLAMISAYNEQKDKKGLKDACYHFVLQGVVYNVTVHLTEQYDSIPSITSFFANADWHEREMMELYGVKITGHPNPSRLFLDETLDAGLLGEIVPLSIMMNGANSKDLWERILSEREAGK